MPIRLPAIIEAEHVPAAVIILRRGQRWIARQEVCIVLVKQLLAMEIADSVRGWVAKPVQNIAAAARLAARAAHAAMVLARDHAVEAQRAQARQAAREEDLARRAGHTLIGGDLCRAEGRKVPSYCQLREELSVQLKQVPSLSNLAASKGPFSAVSMNILSLPLGSVGP